MTTEPRQEAERGLEERILLRRRLSRRGFLAIPFPRGTTAAQGGAVAGRQPLRPVRCGACGGHHVLVGDCPVEAHQRALARGFRIGHKVVSPRSESEIREDERGS